MPTDHACHAAAQEAARGITPVRVVLAPARRPPAPRPQDEDVPIVIRQYLDPGGIYAHEREAPGSAAPEPTSTAMGGIVLVTFLDGLRADLTGVIAEWYADLLVRIPHALSVPATMAPELEPPGEPSEWAALSELKKLGEELLTVIARVPPSDRMNQLSWRLSLVEDSFSGALRRLDVPVEVSVDSAAEVASAAGSLFGMQRIG
ncbi:hypothetical protein [Streptomyces sp. 6N223]|uniref:hypothetical protein n=1 Tax=Streptomyces sp. 6N223 TaxID=3457412 RepID=UPI003FD48896